MMSLESKPSNVFHHSAGFNLGVTYRKISQLFTLRLKSHDITPEQWIVLYCIGENDGMIQKEIAELAGKDRPTTTRILDALEAKGFIIRNKGLTDRRSFLIGMTEKGQELIRQTIPIERQAVEDATQGITSEEYAQLLSILKRIGENVDRLSEKE
ncbi:MAG: transcriptional regulator [Paenibacillus sp.]|nr:transcriptional regulator [Paenibacillus sp.]